MNQKIAIASLGPSSVPSPLRLDRYGSLESTFVHDNMYYQDPIEMEEGNAGPIRLFEKAGPRKHLFFEPAKAKVAIVTCGGLCPGMNNVIRSVYVQLHYHYGVPAVLGIRTAFLVFLRSCQPAHVAEFGNGEQHPPEGWHPAGNIARAGQPDIVVDFLQAPTSAFSSPSAATARSAARIAWRKKCGGAISNISIIGIPKTIDDDVQYVNRSFGYFTAVDKAKEVIDSAHVEARCVLNGISIVKVMGRDSGFIAAGATLASQEVNFTLVPEVPFTLEGEGGLLSVLHRRLLERRHAVIVVAEGAGQELLPHSEERDASGNRIHRDIGLFLRESIKDYFVAQRMGVVVRYLDPSYYIRSVPASTVDSVLCDSFARHAVHAAMAGKTDMIVGLQHGVFIHVPIPMATHKRKRLSNEEWAAVVTATGQPDLV